MPDSNYSRPFVLFGAPRSGIRMLKGILSKKIDFLPEDHPVCKYMSAQYSTGRKIFDYAEILRMFPSERSGRWGWGDAANLLFLHEWLEVFPLLRPVFIFRNPASFAASLMKSDGVNIADGLVLWLTYHKYMQSFIDGRMICLDFDKVIDRPESILDAFGFRKTNDDYDGLTLDETDISCIDSSLRHQHELFKIPPHIQMAYNFFQAKS